MNAKTLAEVLAENTKEGELYKELPDGRLQCFACGHRCPIPEGKAGVCRVRFNQGNKLFVPAGYVGCLQDDPIEKKPFFHAMPGSRALSFGMLGCDFHCGYCFSPKTRIVTTKGIFPIGEIVSQRMDVEVYTHKGRHQKIKTFFKRPYKGKLFKIKLAFLPEFECTPEHPLLARLRPDRFPRDSAKYIEAGRLDRDYCLTLPKQYKFSEEISLKVRDYLEPFTSSYRINRNIPAEILKRILTLTEEGLSSKNIAKEIGKSASHIRHLRSNIKSGKWNLENLDTRKARLIEKSGKIRFSKEHSPGIPAKIKLGSEFAELLGFYCAEGCVVRSQNRVHSAKLDFAFGKREEDKVLKVKSLMDKIFGIKCAIIERQTTLAVSTGKTSVALLFKSLCGEKGLKKKVPDILFKAKRQIVQSFLDAYVAGDGYRAPDGHIRTSTISEELAWGIAGLVQKMGHLPQFYKYPAMNRRKLLGRTIRQSPWTYLVRWYESPQKQRDVWEDEHNRYVRIKKIEAFDYDGEVYNLETEKDHTYLANFVSAHNCQNWVTSQVMRDPVATAPPIKISAKQLVKLAIDRDCKVITSTYNEPLITSEWAVEIFKEAKKAGLVTSYVSNGNATPEVLDYIRPWVDLYKVDLKGFNEKHYHELGGSLDNICRSIRDIYERKFWVEIVTLLIPGFNDSDDEIKKLTEFIVSVSPDIPWHCTAFHPDYKMTDHDFTPVKTLMRAAEIGKKAGLHYIYPGNMPGKVGNGENTYCPDCRSLLITRFGFQVLEDKLTSAQGKCFKCGKQIPGFWKKMQTRRSSQSHVEPLF